MEKKRSLLVCIVIVNWNGLDITKNCVDSLFKITNYKNFKVILVDNDSKDKSQEFFSKYKNIDFIQLNKNVGYAPGINIGWRYCINKYRPDYLCNINNDVVFNQKDWLNIMIEKLEQDPSYGISGNKLIFPDGKIQLLHTELATNEKKVNSEVKSISGTSMLIKRNVIDKIGALDENFFYGADDMDYCLRARKNGFKIIYNDKAEMIHLGSYSYRKSKRDFIYEHQSYCQMVFAFRYGSLLEKIKMPFIQLFRAFVTRKIPFEQRTWNNTDIHWNIFKRLYIYTVSFFRAVKDFKSINQGYFTGKIAEPKNI